MAGQISRYTGPTVPPSWFDMADSAAQQQAMDARDKVVAALAQGDPSPPSGATAVAPAPLFGPIAAPAPAPNRSGQRLGKPKPASAMTFPKREAPFPDMLAQNYDPKPWDKRADGSDKGMGFLGLLQRPDGNVSSEISASFDDVAGGKDIPLLVPTLNRDEVQALLSTPEDDPNFYDKVPHSVFQKAIDFARQREAKGLPVFAQPYEYVNPAGTNSSLRRNQQNKDGQHGN